MEPQKVICDTDVIIEWWKINSPRHIVTEQIVLNKIGRAGVAISVMTEFELLQGAIDKKDMNQIRKDLQGLNRVEFTSEITRQAITLLIDYRLSHGLSIPDSLIASTAIQLDSELFTLNTKHFSFIKGLKLFKP